jgi:hypothetical protein
LTAGWSGVAGYPPRFSWISELTWTAGHQPERPAARSKLIASLQRDQATISIMFPTPWTGRRYLPLR